MQGKNFIRNSLTLLGSGALMFEACKKAAANTPPTGNCIVTPDEVECPYPYVGGEISNPLFKSDITAGQTGISLTLNFVVINTANNCVPIQGKVG